MARLILYFLLLPVTVQNVSAQHNDSTPRHQWYVPHYVPAQFAGNIGLFSLGVGYSSNHDNYHINFLYGYVPSSVAGTEIHTITAKNIFPLTRYGMPSHYPEGYYDFPKNVHVIAYGGARLQHLFQEDFKLLRGMEFYCEAGTVDIYLWYKAMSNHIRLNQIFSVALGVNLLLPN